MLITLYKIGELHFRLLGTNGFHVKAKSERFTASSSRCRQNLKCENFTSLFGRLRQSIAPKSVPHVQHDCFSLFNQSNQWFVALPLTLPSSNLKLPNAWRQQRLWLDQKVKPGAQVREKLRNTMQKREKLNNWLLCFRVSSFLVHVCKFREKFTSLGNEEYIKHVWYNAYRLDRHMSRQNVSAKNKETAEQTVQGRSQNFSKEGSHCVKVRVLTRLSLWHFRHLL